MNEEKLAQLFTKWDRRYRNDPTEYQNIVEHLLKETPYTYGIGAARYFTELAKEMKIKL